MTGLRGLCRAKATDTKTRHTRDPNLLPNYERVLARNAGLKKGKQDMVQNTLTEKINVLGIAGSLRKNSYNRALLRAAQELTW